MLRHNPTRTCDKELQEKNILKMKPRLRRVVLVHVVSSPTPKTISSPEDVDEFRRSDVAAGQNDDDVFAFQGSFFGKNLNILSRLSIKDYLIEDSGGGL